MRLYRGFDVKRLLQDAEVQDLLLGAGSVVPHKCPQPVVKEVDQAQLEVSFWEGMTGALLSIVTGSLGILSGASLFGALQVYLDTRRLAPQDNLFVLFIVLGGFGLSWCLMELIAAVRKSSGQTTPGVWRLFVFGCTLLTVCSVAAFYLALQFPALY